MTVSWCDDGRCHGTAVYDLEPGGARECLLHLPNGYELIQMSVEGMPVAPEEKGDSPHLCEAPSGPSRQMGTVPLFRYGGTAWRFPLASQRLPQRVEVLFRGNMPHADRAGRHEFQAPTLGDLPVRQTLWTVIGPDAWQIGNLPHDSAILTVSSPWQQELMRLRSTAACIAAAADDPNETPRWYPRWARRLAASRVLLQRELTTAGAGEETAGIKSEADSIQRQNVELAARLGTADALARISVAGAMADSPAAIFQRSLDVERPAARFLFEGWADSLALDYRHTDGDWFSYRMVVAAALLTLTCLTVAGLTRGTLTETLRRWPHLAGVALGLAWWLWLWPSVVGLGIALASAVAAARQRMAGRA